MPDPFFSTAKSKKRKRSDSTPNAGTPRNTKKLHRVTRDGDKRHGSAAKVNGVSKKKKMRDEELSDQTDEGGVDEMDLRAEEPDPRESGDEDEDETPAAKRLRLAQLYLDSVKTSLGAPVCSHVCHLHPMY